MLVHIDHKQSYFKWWMAMTAPHLSYHKEYMQYNELGMRTDGITPEVWQQELSHSWGITDRLSLHLMVDALVKGQIHGHLCQEDIAHRAFSTDQAWHQHIRNISHTAKQGEMQFIDVLYRQVGRAGFLAWDYCRGAFLIRSGYYMGWASEEETAFWLSHLAHQAQMAFDGWQSYITSFIFGRTYWQYLVDPDPDETNLPYLLNDGMYIGVSNFFETIELDQSCPIHDVAWDTPLPVMREIPSSLEDVFRSIRQEPEST